MLRPDRRWTLALALLAAISCQQNRPPAVVSVRGAGYTQPGSVAQYLTVVEDPDLDSVRCVMSWGDGTAADTSPWVMSLDTAWFEHSWADTGRYPVQVRAWDGSGASAPVYNYGLIVCRTALPPTAPDVDSTWGPGFGFTGTRYEFGARATDVNRDLIRYRFRWDDGTESEWSRWMRPGTDWSQEHVWQNDGDYEVMVQCEDKSGLSGDWVLVSEVRLLCAPHHRWEASLDEPGLAIPMVLDNEVVVVDQGTARRLDRRNGEALGEYLGPGNVSALAASEHGGVFLADGSSVWGFVGGDRWEQGFSQHVAGLVVEEELLLVACPDTCWFLDFETGVHQETLAIPDGNWIAPVQDGDRVVYCLGDSLRAFAGNNEPLGSYPAPLLQPEEMVVNRAQLSGFTRVVPDKTVVVGFDTTGTRWEYLAGSWASTEGPSCAVTAGDGTVVWAARDTVFAASRNGTLKWRWGAGAGSAVTSGTVCLGDRGTVFAGVTAADHGWVVALDSAGKEQWRVSLECRAPQGIVLGQDSVLYGIGADDPAVFAVYVAEPPARDPCWPMYRHDAALSGRLAGP